MIFLFLIETHMHTNQVSACGCSTGAEMAREYKRRGYDAVIVTDHFFNGNTCIDRSLAWEEKVKAFTKGYEDAKAEGDKIGLKVFFGFEYNHKGAEFLVLNISPEFLLKHPEILAERIGDFFSIVHENGGYIIHAHPYREADYLYMIRLYPDFVDAVEVYNAGNYPDRPNIMANIYADAYGLPKTAGSDLHDATRFRGSGMAFDEEIETLDDFIRLVSEGKGMPIIKGEVLKFRETKYNE